MSVHARAASLLAALFDDGGVDVLDAAGLVPDWAQVIAPIPEVLLKVDDGAVLLGRLRDLFAQAQRLHVAIVFADALWQRNEQELGKDHTDTLVARGRLGALLDKGGHSVDAGLHMEAAWRGLRQREPDLRTAVLAADIGRHFHANGDVVRAELALDQAYRIRRVVAPTRLGLVAAQLAEVKLEVGKEEEAAELLQESWEQLRAEKGEGDRVTLDRARTLGPLWLRLDQPARAAPVLRSLWGWVRLHGPLEEKAQVSFDLGRSLDATGHKEEGLRLMEQGLGWTRTLLDEDGRPHPELPQRLATWARVNEERGHREDAEGHLLEAVEAERMLYGANSAEVGIRQVAVGDLVYRMGRLDEAIGWMDAGLSLLRGTVGDEHQLVVIVAERLIDFFLEKADQCIDVYGDAETGWEYIYQARGLCLDVLGPEHPSHRTLKYYRS